MRVAALWFPDWPVQVARMDTPLPGSVVVAQQHRVHVCDAAARQMGIVRGMRVRQAQALCPELTVVEAAPDRDGAAFAHIAAGLDDVASSVEVLRPGLVLADAAAAARFHGSEDTALEMLVDAASRQGLDATIGAADEIATAVIAARSQGLGAVVEPGGSQAFLAGQSVRVLHTEPALGCPESLVGQLYRLGVRTLGDVARLPERQMATRFGGAGQRAYAIATAQPDRRVSPELQRPELAVETVFDEPLERVDAAAFAARKLAARLHAGLAAAGVVCLRLRVVAELSNTKRVERVWRTREALSESATADRVRWQLDGWLSASRAESAGIGRLSLEPVETATPSARGLWGGEDTAVKARRVIERVQSQLGVDRVVQPCSVGGRGVADRVALVPYGEQAVALPAWEGAVLAPLPSLLGGGRAQLGAADGQPVFVTAEAVLSAVPQWLDQGGGRHRVVGWAGPWPVDEAWWTPEGTRLARLQVLCEGPRAWLLVWREGRWEVEGEYA